MVTINTIVLAAIIAAAFLLGLGAPILLMWVLGFRHLTGMGRLVEMTAPRAPRTELIDVHRENATLATDSCYIQGKIDCIRLGYSEDGTSVTRHPFGKLPKSGVEVAVLMHDLKKVTIPPDRIKVYAEPRQNNEELGVTQ
jgi:hypothetical protein